MSLLTLDEYEQKILDERENSNKTGIACPACSKELLCDTLMVLASHPPKQAIYCPECNYRGYRTV